MAEQLSEDQIRQQFPAYAWLLNIPEIRDILSDPQYTNNPNAKDQIQARVQGTKWWQTTESSMRTYEQLQAQDPEGLNQQQRQKEADIWDAYIKSGITPVQGDVQQLATQALQHNWNASQLQDAIMTHAKFSPDVVNGVGQLQTNTATLRQMAQTYGVDISDQTAFDWAKSIGAGEHTITDFTPQMQNWAESKYPAWAEQIKGGYTVEQLTDPYRQQTAKLLEKSPDTVDLFDNPQYSKMLNYTDPKNGEQRPMTLTEAATYTRGLDAWKGTQQGQQAASSAVEGILQMFGKVKSGSTPNFTG